MNRAISRDIDTDHIPIQKLTALLETFALKHSFRKLADILKRAENNESSYRAFLYDLLKTEVKGCNERRKKRNYSRAHFPPNVRPIEDFDSLELESGIMENQLRQLKELNRLDTNANLVLVDPLGLGKTMIATALGLEAINSGYTVYFERMTNLSGSWSR